MKKLLSLLLVSILSLTFATTTESNAFGDDLGSNDELAPVIDGYEGVIFSQQSNPVELAQITALLSASDNVDGDLTDSIVILSDTYSSNSETIGIYNITYYVEDSSGNSANIVVQVRVVDVSKPIITLQGPSYIKLEYGVHSNVDFERDIPTAIVSDNVDDDLEVTVTNNYNYQEIGTYYFYYNATDSAGNVADTVVLTVEVADTSNPQITLIGSDMVFVEAGENYEELGATCTDNSQSCEVSITGSVNLGQLGANEITYSYTDSSGNTGFTKRIVVVQDTIAPVISGDTQLTYTVGSSPSTEELVATMTAFDTFDGDVTDNITISQDNLTGNENKAGSYLIVIEVLDSTGNLSYAEIQVLLVDNTAPVFSASTLFMTIEEADAMTLEDLYTYFGLN